MVVVVDGLEHLTVVILRVYLIQVVFLHEMVLMVFVTLLDFVVRSSSSCRTMDKVVVRVVVGLCVVSLVVVEGKHLKVVILRVYLIQVVFHLGMVLMVFVSLLDFLVRSSCRLKRTMDKLVVWVVMLCV